MSKPNGKKPVAPGAAAPGNGSELPHWLAVLKHDLEINGEYDFSYHQGVLSVHPHACPECHYEHRVKKFAGKRPDPAALEEIGRHITTFRTTADEYIAELAQLQDKMGFVIDRTAQPPQLRQEEYDVTVALQGDAALLLKQARQAKELYEEKWLEHNVNGTPVVSHPRVVKGPKAPADKAHAEQPFELPAGEKTVLVFDACVMEMLAEPRAAVGHLDAKAHTWLDIINKTSQLPNVTIVIPSFVADWESQGKTVLFSKDGKHVHTRQIDHQEEQVNSNKHYYYKTIGNFLKTASRARLDEHGRMQLIEGENKNIIIWESKHDREMHEKTNQVIDDKRLTWTEAWKKIDEEVRHHDEGEKCIEAFLRETPFHSPHIIVSQDHRWFQTRRHIQSTHLGFPAGEANFAAYVGAEMKTRGPALQKAMKEPGHLTMHGILHRINAHRVDKDKGRHTDVFHSTTGAYSSPMLTPRPPETIERVIQQGVELSNGHYERYTPAHSSVLSFLSSLPWEQDAPGRYAVSSSGLEKAVTEHFPSVHAGDALSVARAYLTPGHSDAMKEDVYYAGAGQPMKDKETILFRNGLTDRLEAKYGLPDEHARLRQQPVAEEVAGLAGWDVRKPGRNIEGFAGLQDLSKAIPGQSGPAWKLLGQECHAVRGGDGAVTEVIASDWLKKKILDRQPALSDRVNQLYLDALDSSVLPESSRQHFAAQITTTSGMHQGDWLDRLQMQKEVAQQDSSPSVTKR